MYIEMILKVATFCICRNIRVGTFWKIPEHSSFWNYNQVHLHSQMQASIISELDEVVEGQQGELLICVEWLREGCWWWWKRKRRMREDCSYAIQCYPLLLPCCGEGEGAVCG